MKIQDLEVGDVFELVTFATGSILDGNPHLNKFRFVGPCEADKWGRVTYYECEYVDGGPVNTWDHDWTVEPGADAHIEHDDEVRVLS